MFEGVAQKDYGMERNLDAVSSFQWGKVLVIFFNRNWPPNIVFVVGKDNAL